MALSDTKLRNLKPGDKPYCETDEGGLHIEVMPGGAKVWRLRYPVTLEWTSLHFGGRRAWFLCPARGCGRRVAVLYGGSTFACRYCHKLVYECQRETADDRAMRRADTIRRRLKWPRG